MKALEKFKLVSDAAGHKNPAIDRRNKLTSKLAVQIAAAKAQAGGDTFVATRKKLVLDSETKARKVVETPVRFKQWWSVGPTGTIVLGLRYGAKPIELAKGKSGIECNSMEELIAALEAVKDAVTAGELDAQIEATSGSLRAGFAKKK